MPEDPKPVPHTPRIKIPSGGVKSEPRETPSLVRNKPEPEKEAAKPETEKQEINPFDNEQVKAAWEQFKSGRMSRASDTEKLVLDRRVEKSGEETIRIFLESQLEISILEKFEGDLVRFMRKELANTIVQLEKEVTEQENGKNLYTSKEKFEYMAEQNPELRKLKDRLGLDFEY